MATDDNIVPYVSADTVKLADFLMSSISGITTASGITKQNLISWLSSFMEANEKIFLELSTTRPDFESIKQQFISRLLQKDTWKDVIQSGGGETILEFVAAIGSLGQAGIVVASQETNLDDAILTSSVYVLMRMLGVHIRRKIPAKTLVILTNSENNALVIPRLSQFSINGIFFFNREPIIFNIGTPTVTTTLYQGQILTDSYLSSGMPYQRYELGQNQFDVADTDVYCFTPAGEEWIRVENGLWNYSANDRIFYENTTPEGNVEILIGNNMYGATPLVNTILNYVYITTNGMESNSNAVGLSVSVVAPNQITPDRIRRANDVATQIEVTRVATVVTGSTIGPIEEGDNGKDRDHYRAVGPFLFSAKKGMIRKNDHYGVGLEFPGVADILLQNQKDIQPYNRNLINVVYVTPLMRDGIPITEAQWNDMINYFVQRQIWRVDWHLDPPREVLVDIRAKLFCSLDSEITNIEPYAEFKLRQKFGIRRGSLGYSLQLNDLYDILKLNYQGLKVDYIEMLEPQIDIPLNKTDYIKINNVELTVDYSRRGYIPFAPPRPEEVIPI
jgi:hypothetical protein